MAAGLPVVSTDVSNISEIIVDGKTGYLAEAGNNEDIASKMLKMITQKNKIDFGIKGRKVIENNFSLKIMIENIKRFLN
jgi:glycosyltransferase involved in cell wall biosynthesis